MAKSKAAKKETTLADVYLFDAGYKSALEWVQDQINLHALQSSDDMSVLVFCEEVEARLKNGKPKPRKEAPRVD